MNNKNRWHPISVVARFGATLACIVALAACASPALVPAAQVTIKFIGDCPDSVSPDPVNVNKSQRIEWQSDPVNKRYSIHYDPFHGQPLNSNASGFKKSPPIDSSSPDIPYKYTVIGDNCAVPLDPRIVVN